MLKKVLTASLVATLALSSVSMHAESEQPAVTDGSFQFHDDHFLVSGLEHCDSLEQAVELKCSNSSGLSYDELKSKLQNETEFDEFINNVVLRICMIASYYAANKTWDQASSIAPIMTCVSVENPDAVSPVVRLKMTPRGEAFVAKLKEQKLSFKGMMEIAQEIADETTALIKSAKA